MIVLSEISAEETLRRARRVNGLEGFKLIPEHTFDRLLATAPSWPKKPGCIRTLRFSGKGFKPSNSFSWVETFWEPLAMASHLAPKDAFSLEPVARDRFESPGGEYVNAGWVILDLFDDAKNPRSWYAEPAAGQWKKLPDGRSRWETCPKRIDEELIKRSAHARECACLEGLLAGLWLMPEPFEQILEELAYVSWRFKHAFVGLDGGWGPVWERLVISGKKRGVHAIPPGVERPDHGFWLDIVSVFSKADHEYAIAIEPMPLTEDVVPHECAGAPGLCQ